MNALTLFHVALSLAGIAAGFVVVYGLIKSQRFDRWTLTFLVTTVATSLTGYLFPFEKLLPSHIIGAISLVVLALAIYALYSRRLAGGWRRTYVVSAVTALYLNFFVLVVQLFLKVPALKALAPTQSEPPFFITQTVVLVAFVYLGVLSAKRFHTDESIRAVAKAA
jgi:hypothetical protein